VNDVDVKAWANTGNVVLDVVVNGEEAENNLPVRRIMTSKNIVVADK
jgi:hypothetical protein